MKTYIEKLPPDVRALIETARVVAQERGCTAYLVGGFVRDLILGVKNFDLDIVVEGDGIAFASDYARRLQGKLVTHHRFGTATVSLGHHVKVDIASARKEVYPQPGHLPVVEAGTLRDDLYRRDFTINAMALQITGSGYGRVIDLFGGRKDLAAKKLRILHPVSFIDDPTRILRGIRFEQRFDFSFERNTLRLLKAAVAESMLERVEPQRLRDELILLLKEQRPAKIIRRISAVAGFSFINPKLRSSPRMIRTLAAIERRVAWFKQHIKNPRQLETWLIFFMGLVGYLPLSEVHAICRRFVFRKGEEKRIVSCVESCSRAVAVLKKRSLRPSEAFRVLEPLSYEVIIIMLALTGSSLVAMRIKEFLNVSIGTKLYVSGHDLSACGLKPGPHYQRILRAVLNAKLDGKVKDISEELRLARTIAARSLR
ncbi:MAG: CCA tRNA nucleotidyltransferase [Candidatus Omnitrophota bacterium]